MICYRDRTFCNAGKHKPDCDRQITEEVIAGGTKWWGSADFPICVGNLCGGKDEIPRRN